MSTVGYLGGGFTYFLFLPPNFRKMIQFDELIFCRWFVSLPEGIGYVPSRQ